jgi:tRNA pseudouridine38-40 synthase
VTADRNLRLTIEYDGTDFSGWQRQDGQRTVQGALEAAFLEMTGETVIIRGAGRTDAGVHAAGQVANVFVGTRIPTGGYLRGLNSYLPVDVAVTAVEDAPPTFDARRSARGKIYRYQIWNHLVRSPLLHRRSWHQRKPLDTDAMRAAAALLVGEHDFRGFRASDCDRKNTIRWMRRFDVVRQGALCTFEVEGTAFLKNMVRIMVGTLAAVGRGELGEATIREVLEGGDRTLAGVTAPAAGLTLFRVIY